MNIKLLIQIYLGSKIVFKEKLKTFLWLPTNTVETPHIYFYFDNYKFYIAFGSVQNYQEIKLT